MRKFVTRVLILILGLNFMVVDEALSKTMMPTETKLANGVTVVYGYIPNIDVVTVQCWIKTGAVNENKNNAGISHFLEHILFKGTKNFKPGEIDSYLDSLGAYNNAFTSYDVTNYYVTIPTINADAAFKVVSDMVFNALFLKDEIEKEKPVVLQEIKRKYDDPAYKMWQDFMETLFAGTPYEREVIGTPETVSALTSETLFDYYNRYYHPQNMTLVISGDITESEALKLANKYFNQKRNVEAGKLYSGSENTFKKSVDKKFKADVNLDYAVIAFPEPDIDKANLKSVYTNTVFAEILSGGEYSILNEELKNNKEVVVDVSAFVNNNEHNGGAFAIYSVTKPGDADKFKAEAMKILKDIAGGKIDDKRIEKAKNRLKSQNVYKSENVSSLAYDLGYAYIQGIKDYSLNFEKGVDEVTKKDIIDYAKSLISRQVYYAKTVAGK